MQVVKNVSLLPTIRKMAKINVHHYADYDLKMDCTSLRSMAREAKKEGKNPPLMLYMQRDAGTSLIPLPLSYKDKSPAFIHWTYYDPAQKTGIGPNSAKSVRAYLIDMTAPEKLSGDIYCMDYLDVCKDIYGHLIKVDNAEEQELMERSIIASWKKRCAKAKAISETEWLASVKKNAFLEVR